MSDKASQNNRQCDCFFGFLFLGGSTFFLVNLKENIKHLYYCYDSEGNPPVINCSQMAKNKEYISMSWRHNEKKLSLYWEVQTCNNSNIYKNPSKHCLWKKLHTYHIKRQFIQCVNNKANLRELIAATGLVILLKLASNHWFFSLCDHEIWWMTRKIKGYFFYTTSSFLHHFKSIGEFELKLQSGNGQFRSKSAIVCPVWPWNLMDDVERQ